MVPQSLLQFGYQVALRSWSGSNLQHSWERCDHMRGANDAKKLRDVECGVEICLCRRRVKKASMPGWLQPFPSCKMRRSADASPLGRQQCEGHVQILHPISTTTSKFSNNKCCRPMGRSFLASPLLGTLNMPLVCYMSGSLTLPTQCPQMFT